MTEERTYPLSCLEQTRAALLTALDHEPDMKDLKSVLPLTLPGTLPGMEAVLVGDAPEMDWYEAVQKFASGILEEWCVGIRLGKRTAPGFPEASTSERMEVMEKRKTSKIYSADVRERAVRMVSKHRGEHASEWAALVSISVKIG